MGNLVFSRKFRQIRLGVTRAEIPFMSTMTFKVNRKSGEYVKPSLIPANHSAQSRFGALDAAIIGFFALCVGGLVFLLLQF